MFLFHPIHFLKFLVKSQPQRSYKKGSYKKKSVIRNGTILVASIFLGKPRAGNFLTMSPPEGGTGDTIFSNFVTHKLVLKIETTKYWLQTIEKRKTSARKLQ